MTGESYYIVDVDHNPVIYLAKTDQDFIDYMIGHIDDFFELFLWMHLTDSNFKKRLPDVYGPYAVVEDMKFDQGWSNVKKLICRELQNMSFDQLVSETEGKCSDQHLSQLPCVAIRKRSITGVIRIV
jgi:hypothetical protein